MSLKKINTLLAAAFILFILGLTATPMVVNGLLIMRVTRKVAAVPARPVPQPA
ncbi:hypothetical protein [Streptomyces sp. PTD9-10]|uniref:hypothetical protein n=1 Tax=Streptomyces sp. PTD9-10 TaxID=3120151 RepID=UPI00300AC070